jgi:hypothetical protein
LKREQDKFKAEKALVMKAMQEKDAKLESLAKQVAEKDKQLSFLQQELPAEERDVKLKLQDQQKQLA